MASKEAIGVDSLTSGLYQSFRNPPSFNAGKRQHFLTNVGPVLPFSSAGIFRSFKNLTDPKISFNERIAF